MKCKTGFTIVELLVVTSIIGLLSSIVLSSVNSTRLKAADAQNLETLKQIQNAIIMYYDQNGYYPKMVSLSTDFTYCTTFGYEPTWCALETELKPYIAKFPHGIRDFRYASYLGDNYQTYGLSVPLRDTSNYALAANDGGWYNGTYNGLPEPDFYWYEVGDLPKYCMDKYPDPVNHMTDRWWRWDISPDTLCGGGN